MAKKLQIISKRDGFRRAGHAFSSTPTLLDPADLKKEQIEALKAEPMLVVVEVDVKEEKPAGKKTGGAGKDDDAAGTAGADGNSNTDNAGDAAGKGDGAGKGGKGAGK